MGGQGGEWSAGWSGVSRSRRGGSRHLAFFPNESVGRDRARGASGSRAGVSRQQVSGAFSTNARAVPAARGIVDGPRAKRHAGGTAKGKTGRAGKIVSRTRARAEQSVCRGAPPGGGAAGLPAALAHGRPRVER